MHQKSETEKLTKSTIKTIPSGLQVLAPVKKEDEGVYLPKDSPLQRSFIQGFIGKPGCGKTNLIKSYLKNPDLYRSKFHKVLVLSPNKISDLDLEYGDNYMNSLDLEWLYKRIGQFKKMIISENEINQQIHREKNLEKQNDMDIDGFSNTECMDIEETNEKPQPIKMQVLIIIDDLVSSIRKKQYDPNLTALFFNRRHLMDNKDGTDFGCVSIIVTAQHYKMIPAPIRESITAICFFGGQVEEYKSIKAECIYTKADWLDRIIEMIFKEDPHNFVYIDKQTSKLYMNFDLLVL